MHPIILSKSWCIQPYSPRVDASNHGLVSSTLFNASNHCLLQYFDTNTSNHNTFKCLMHPSNNSNDGSKHSSKGASRIVVRMRTFSKSHTKNHQTLPNTPLGTDLWCWLLLFHCIIYSRITYHCIWNQNIRRCPASERWGDTESGVQASARVTNLQPSRLQGFRASVLPQAF